MHLRCLTACCLIMLSCLAEATPCAPPPMEYPDKEASFEAKVYFKGDALPHWPLETCPGWTDNEWHARVIAVGRIRSSDLAEIASRVGAISSLSGLTYWSVTRNRRTTLISEAYALTGPGSSDPRPDFDAEELTTDSELYYHQNEATGSGAMTYQLRVLFSDAHQFVFSTSNVTPSRRLGITLLEPGGSRALTFITHLSDDQWGILQFSELSPGLHRMFPVSKASYANRMTSLFAHLADIPTEKLPVQRTGNND